MTGRLRPTFIHTCLPNWTLCDGGGRSKAANVCRQTDAHIIRTARYTVFTDTGGDARNFRMAGWGRCWGNAVYSCCTEWGLQVPCLQPSSIRGLAIPRTTDLHCNLLSAAIRSIPVSSLVRILMLSIREIFGLPLVLLRGSVPWMISLQTASVTPHDVAKIYHLSCFHCCQ